ncbi:MAG TPA: phytase [Xanthomonadales bacterium]|nr:phytase [Xanthomonadales bacterium]
MKKSVLALFPVMFAMLLAACGPAPETAVSEPQATADPADEVAPETVSAVQLAASAETVPVQQGAVVSAALLLDRESPADSRIVGAAGEGGIEVYALDGQRLYTDASRRVTLVDSHYNFDLAGQDTSLIVAIDAASSELLAYTLDAADNSLHLVSQAGLVTGIEVGGLCLYHSPLSDKFYAFVLGEGYAQQWELYDKEGVVTGRRIRNLPVGFGAAQCAASDRDASLYYSQETVGVWRFNAEPESDAEPEPIDLAQPFGRFSGDVKGLALLEYADEGGYLLVSDADAGLFHAYALPELQHAATFTIADAGDGNGVDGVGESEGLAVTGLALSDDFPQGLLVVADEENADKENNGGRSNYKLLSWQAVAEAAGLATAAPYDKTLKRSSTAITVSPSVNTVPVESHGDAADDPSIWVHPSQPELSLVLGTQKQQGLNVYDLQGQLLQSLPDGRINNTDLRYGFPLDGQPVDIVAVSNRSNFSIGIYAVDPQSRTLSNVADGLIPTDMGDPYGLCMYRSTRTGNYFVYVNDTDGRLKQWQLKDAGNGRIGAEVVREIQLDSQTEGCVADDETGDLYVGEEDVGIWKYSAEPDGGDARTRIDSVAEGNLTDDVEGLSLYYGVNGAGYLIASNQGADNYAIYERADENKFLGMFHIVADEATGIDGASETDGLDVTAANLGPAFPHGMLVVQDGRNITPDEKQNYKLVPWERVAKAMGLNSNDSFNPRR